MGEVIWCFFGDLGRSEGELGEFEHGGWAEIGVVGLGIGWEIGGGWDWEMEARFLHYFVRLDINNLNERKWIK